MRSLHKLRHNPMSGQTDTLRYIFFCVYCFAWCDLCVCACVPFFLKPILSINNKQQKNTHTQKKKNTKGCHSKLDT